MKIEAKNGEHYWALLDDKLIIVMCEDADNEFQGYFTVCGPWEETIRASEEELKLVERIKKPLGYASKETYYSQL